MARASDRVVTPTPPLPGPFGALAPLLNSYGYLALGGLLFVEDFGIPAPGETILIAASVYAGAGHLNIALVVVIGFAAAVGGDSVGFAIGHFGGRPLVLRFGRYVFLTEERLDETGRFFARHGGKIVAIARFVERLRQANGLVAGLAGMRWSRFVAFKALGAALWVTTWSAVGYLAGNHLTAIYEQLHRDTLYVLPGVAVIVVVLIGRRLWRVRTLQGGIVTVVPGVGQSSMSSKSVGVTTRRALPATSNSAGSVPSTSPSRVMSSAWVV